MQVLELERLAVERARTQPGLAEPACVEAKSVGSLLKGLSGRHIYIRTYVLQAGWQMTSDMVSETTSTVCDRFQLFRPVNDAYRCGHNHHEAEHFI